MVYYRMNGICAFCFSHQPNAQVCEDMKLESTIVGTGNESIHDVFSDISDHTCRMTQKEVVYHVLSVGKCVAVDL